jgi:hypothetical protein
LDLFLLPDGRGRLTGELFFGAEEDFEDQVSLGDPLLSFFRIRSAHTSCSSLIGLHVSSVEKI